MEKPSTARIALKWGIIGGLATILVSLLIYNTSLMKMTWVGGTLSFVLFVVLLTLAIREYKGLNNNFLKIGEGIGVGTLAGTVMALISTLFQFFYVKFIDTEFYQKQADLLEETYIQQGLSEEQIDMLLQQVNSMNDSGLTILFGVIGTVIMALLISLVISLIMRKNPPVFD